ncbi:MAG: STAS/SEC14 domain-containing protein [Verrucomicrobia bacterium]|nr:STAS/SEC14 domain-containing protein [Verrucomicrobiota bacterium]
MRTYHVVSLEVDVSGIAVVRISERLTGEDYERVAPRLDRYRRVLVEPTRDFEGGPTDAAWSAPEPPWPSRPRQKRVAVIARGEPRSVLEATFRRLFPNAEIRFFDPDARNAAKNWLLDLGPVNPLPPASG